MLLLRLDDAVALLSNGVISELAMVDRVFSLGQSAVLELESR